MNETEVPPGIILICLSYYCLSVSLSVGLTGYVDTNLFEPASYDYKRPYMCNSFYNLTVNTNNRDYKMIIGFSDLTVQAFEFDHTDDPGFSNINSGMLHILCINAFICYYSSALSTGYCTFIHCTNCCRSCFSWSCVNCIDCLYYWPSERT